MVADYRYYFGSLRTDGVIAEIPLFGTYIDMTLNVGGTFNGSFQLDQTGKRNQDLIDATIPGFSYVMVERNEVVIWGGFIWSRTYQSQAKIVQLYASSFDMYPGNVLIDVDLLGLFTATDQRNLFVGLWNLMQSKSQRHLGITMPGTFPDVVVYGGLGTLKTDNKYFGELMSQISDTETGFDWYISCSRVGSKYIKTLNIGYPTIGQALSDSSLVIEYPGSITNYYQTEAMADAGTKIIVTGSGDGSSQVIGTAENTVFYDRGWPEWDRVISHKELFSNLAAPGALSIPDQTAAQELSARLPPKTTIKATMKGDATPEFGSWGLGDMIRVVIKDPRNPNGLTFPGRILKWTLSPPTSTNVEEYGLIFQGDDNG